MADENKKPRNKDTRYLGLIIAIVAIVVTILLAIWQYSPPPPDFSISLKPMQGTVHQGAAITTDVTIKGVYGYEEPVSLSATGQPSGVVLAFAPQSAEAKPSYTSRVMINVNSNVLVDDYTIGIKGTGADGKEHRCSYILTVKPSVTPTSTSISTPTPTPPSTPTPTGDADLREAEKLAGDWFAAMVDRDIGTLVNMADTPFFFDREILVSIEDVREEYRDFLKFVDLQDVQIFSLKGMKISEYRKTCGGDWILSSLRLDDEDVVVIMILGMEGQEQSGTMLFFRKVNQEIRMAGLGG